MRYSIGLKFIAIILCAAALFGAVASGAGILCLTGLGLYSKGVDQLWNEQLRSAAENLAYAETRRFYAGTVGGCPEEMLAQYYSGNGSYGLDFAHVSYAILDGEGNLLAGYGDLTAETAETTITVPVFGKYPYLVSATPASQLEAQRAAADNAQAQRYTGENGYYYYCAVAPEGSFVNWVSFRDRDGNMLFQAPSEGLVYWDQTGTLTYRSVIHDYVPDSDVYTVDLKGENDVSLFFVSGPERVGRIYCDDSDRLIFKAEPPVTGETVPETTVAETTQATVPQTLPATEPETLPPETNEAAPEDTDATAENPDGAEENPDGAEEDASSASAMPEEEGEEGGSQEEDPAPEETAAPETLPPETAAPETLPPETVPPETVPETTEPILIDGKPLREYEVIRDTYFDNDTNEDVWVEYVYATLPPITVEVYAESGALQREGYYSFLAMLVPYRNDLFLTLGVSLLLFAALAVYLCCVAGRKPKTEEIHARGLSCLPLDVGLTVTVVGCAGLAVLILKTWDSLIEGSLLMEYRAALAMMAVGALAACLLAVGFLFSAVAQFKTPGGYWWRNLLLFRVLGLGIGAIQWCWALLTVHLLPWLVGAVKWLWNKLAGLLSRLGRWAQRTVHRVMSLLPVTWQWLLGGAVLLILPVIGLAASSEGLLVLGLAADVALIVYGAFCFGTLMRAAKRMSKGNLNVKVENKNMVGAFKEFAGDLNDLADVAIVAAKKQLRSERMKTELITNVSHDIKTPLTSIINYVDLLQKPHTQQEQEQYLEVLSRQSLGLKKLIEDLMEMSKASTGNMAVDLETVDAVESVNQALGEFSDKLERAQLTPVFRHTEDSVLMTADGRLTWRVLNNLLSNAVKYAMPGTRLYIDLMSLEGKVTISLKNISREALNVPADELMERFVRGDDSRNTEGSGLGLNIASSLMELQKGQLQLLVDGDLFKVTLIFPAAG